MDHAPKSAVGDAVRTALIVLTTSRAVVFLVGYLAVFIFGYPGGRPPIRDFQSELLNLPSRFDARWYLQIANDGYAFDRAAPADVQQNVVFFPAFPMTIRAAKPLFGGGVRGSFLAGTTLSLIAFGAALVYLYLLALDVGGDSCAAAASAWLIAFYPFSIFYGAIYTESFFLLATIGSIRHARRREHRRAAMWGLIAGLTRPNGFLLAVPLAWMAIKGSQRSRTLAVAAAPVAGLLIYATFLWTWTGDPWLWARGHAAWGRTYQGLVGLVASRYEIITNGGVARYLADLPHDALNGVGTVFTLAMVWPAARRLGIEYATWMLLMLLPPLAAGGLISAGRFSSVLFPAFVALGGAVPERRLPGWIGAFAALQALCAAMFYTWRPLY